METKASGSHTPNATASPWVNRYLREIKPNGHILDLAAGSGRHTRLALEAGFSVTAIDRNTLGLGDLAPNSKLTILQHDLENGQPLPFDLQGVPAAFDGVIVTNYLWRPILPDIVSVVGPSGVLIYETFGVGNEKFGRPKNPNFLLRPGELHDAIAGQLTPMAYQHATQDTPPRVISRICAVGRKHPWVSDNDTNR
ncbi:MAG: class I SAM-dependent methyltransferase [Hyphomicrobiaceae bacterium]